MTSSVPDLVPNPDDPGFPIVEDTENHHLVIDCRRQIWWTNKHPDGDVTEMLGIWRGDPFMWGEYDTPFPGRK